MNKKDGGPAFPSHGSMGEVAYEGMSLRDWFAGMAINVACKRSIRESEKGEFFDFNIASLAYEIADAMIRVKEKYNL